MNYSDCHPPHSRERLTHKAAKEATDKIATILKERGPFTVNEIIKAGSLGHGTAVPGNFDLDLVIYSRDIDKDYVLKNGYDKWLVQLKQFLQRDRDVEITNITKHSVQFVYQGFIEVDLLVSPWWDSVKELSLFLDKLPLNKRFGFSVGASKWQVEFMEKQDEQAKVLIQRAKAWRNKQWATKEHGHKKPKSYFLSLLVVKAYELAKKRLGQTHFREMAERTSYELKQLVLNQNSEDIHWGDYYIVGGGGETILHNTPPRPRLLDPANPANNLFDTGFATTGPRQRSHEYEEGVSDWTEIKRKIETIDLTQDI